MYFVQMRGATSDKSSALRAKSDDAAGRKTRSPSGHLSSLCYRPLVMNERQRAVAANQEPLAMFDQRFLA